MHILPLIQGETYKICGSILNQISLDCFKHDILKSMIPLTKMLE